VCLASINAKLFNLFEMANGNKDFMPCVEFFLQHCDLSADCISKLVKFPIFPVERLLRIVKDCMKVVKPDNVLQAVVDSVLSNNNDNDTPTNKLKEHEMAVFSCIFESINARNGWKISNLCSASVCIEYYPEICQLLLSQMTTRIDPKLVVPILLNTTIDNIQFYYKVYELAGKPKLDELPDPNSAVQLTPIMFKCKFVHDMLFVSFLQLFKNLFSLFSLFFCFFILQI